MGKLNKREDVIYILENNEDIRLKFYDVVLNHLSCVHAYTGPEKGWYITLELRGLYKGNNEDFDWLYSLVWDVNDEGSVL